jgi:hypothetical protein
LAFINTYGYDGIHLTPAGHQIYYEYAYSRLTALLAEIRDQDGDGVADITDNCPVNYNPNQEDADIDGLGDICDLCPNDFDNDIDTDGLCGDIDNCPADNNPLQEDTDNSGIGNACNDSIDADNDEWENSIDNCLTTPNPTQQDSYPPPGNGIGDACDCEGNFNCWEDQDVDGSDASTFKTDFGRSNILHPCVIEDTCNGDFNCDGDVDGTDASLFKSDFGRSSIQNPCPVCASGMEWCHYVSCVEECDSELEMCLIGCESWAPDSRYICNDNCVFDYSSNCIPACNLG